ncbi:hypothetical protein Q4571_16860 [Bacillus thuringiensis]|nr:hypothetical protein [Bacillus thuringiensis]
MYSQAIQSSSLTESLTCKVDWEYITDKIGEAENIMYSNNMIYSPLLEGYSGF